MLRDFEHQAVAVVVVSSAFRIAGNSPSKVTSTTAPMTWLMRPTLVVVAVAMVSSLLPSFVVRALLRPCFAAALTRQFLSLRALPRRR
jgi:hypothetical protein